MSQETLFEHADGMAGLHRLEHNFYSSVLADPVLQPLFGAGKPACEDARRGPLGDDTPPPPRSAAPAQFRFAVSATAALRGRNQIPVIAGGMK
jgi:hypothetical protein